MPVKLSTTVRKLCLYQLINSLFSATDLFSSLAVTKFSTSPYIRDFGQTSSPSENYPSLTMLISRMNLIKL
jgi:hypothetical protein